MIFCFLGRIAILLLGGVFILFTFQNCCNKEPRAHYVIKQISPGVTKAIDTNQTTCTGMNQPPADTIWIDLEARGDNVVYNRFNQDWRLIPTAHAKSPCPPKPDENKGLKHHLKAIKVQLKNDTTYDITNQVILKGRNGRTVQNIKNSSVNDWLRETPDFFPNCIRISNISTTDTIFKASVRFTFENGDFVKGKTDTFVWKHH